MYVSSRYVVAARYNMMLGENPYILVVLSEKYLGRQARGTPPGGSCGVGITLSRGIYKRG